MNLKVRIVIFSILFLIGIALLVFFPYGSIFLFGTETLYSGVQTLLDKINKSDDLPFNKILFLTSFILTLINAIVLIIL